MSAYPHPDDLDDDLAFPAPETSASRAARVARERVNAAERAKRWRDDQRDRAALDAAIVVGLGRAFGLRHTVPGGPDGVAAVTLRTIIDESAKAFRNAGGSYDDGKVMVGARLQPLIQNPIRRV